MQNAYDDVEDRSANAMKEQHTVAERLFAQEAEETRVMYEDMAEAEKEARAVGAKSADALQR